MSKVRIVVEWVFKEVTTLFPRLDWVPSQKLLVSPVGLEYPVTVLLHNAHVILHRPQIIQYFAQTLEEARLLLVPLEELGDLPRLGPAPTLEEYFQLPDPPPA
jgi:hypothetical protein